MGYRLTLDQVNVVAQLIEGNTLAVLEETFYSRNNYNMNIQYIKDILEQFGDNFYTESKSYYYSKRQRSQDLIYDLNKINSDELEQLLEKYWDRNDYFMDRLKVLDLLRTNSICQELENILRGIYQLLGTSKVNTILLPGTNRTEFDRYLISEELLNDLVRIHSRDSCLILQPKELPNKDDFYIYNSFRNFDLALNSFKNWPGILLWRKSNAVFVPLSQDMKKGYDEILRIFNLIHYEQNAAIRIIKSIKTELNDDNRYSYILHLSDLHFGKQVTDKRKDYLIKLVDGVNKKLDDGKIELTIITGDLVNSPNDKYYNTFKSFRSKLCEKINSKSIIVFGNHDLYRKGNKMFTLEKQCLYSVNDEDRIEVLSDLKIIIIKIDSNADGGGPFAEGKVGQVQLKEIEQQLSKIEDIEKYFLIAVLHHHPIKLGVPYWKKVNLLKRLFPVLEETLTLKDAPELMKWVNKRNIKLILHGHKHIPNVGNCNGTDVVACGSSTGNITHIERSLTYLSFNLIKFDKKLNKPISCTTYFLDNLSMVFTLL